VSLVSEEGSVRLTPAEVVCTSITAGL
jgi:hypothetical protein